MIVEPDAQRRFVRIPFDRYVDIEFTSDRYEHCQISNLCLDGMFIKGDFKKHEGKLCNIDLVQTGLSTELTMQVLARVVRKDDKGIAVKFTSMSFESYMYLQTSLLYEAEDFSLYEKMLCEDCPFEVTDGPPLCSGENQ